MLKTQIYNAGLERVMLKTHYLVLAENVPPIVITNN